MSEKRNEDFQQVLPDNEVKLSDGRKIVLEPLPIRRLPKLIKILLGMGKEEIAKLQGEEAVDVFLELLSEGVLDLLEEAIPGHTIEEFDLLNDAPLLLGKFMKQNLKVDTIKNWQSLGQTLDELAPGVMGQMFSTK